MSDAALLAAHDAGDPTMMVTLYLAAAEREGGDAKAFFLTQAWIYALDAGDNRAESVRDRLAEMGRV